MIGIIGAMKNEIANLKTKFDNYDVYNYADLIFYKGTMCNHDVVLVQSGVGKVNSAMCTQILVSEFGVDYVINVGIAGALSNTLDIGDIVFSTDLMQYDVDVTAFGHIKGCIPNTESVFVADAHLLEIAYKMNPIKNNSFHFGRIISGDRFISDAESKSELNGFHALCVEMEGASIAHVCSLNKIPFIVIRAISDKADNSAETDYNTFEQYAIDVSNSIILEFLKSI